MDAKTWVKMPVDDRVQLLEALGESVAPAPRYLAGLKLSELPAAARAGLGVTETRKPARRPAKKTAKKATRKPAKKTGKKPAKKSARRG